MMTERAENLLRTYLVAMLFIGAGFFGYFLWVGAEYALYAPIFFISVLIASFISCKVQRSDLARGLQVLAISIVPVWAILFTGGIHSPIVIWLTPPPLIAGVLLGWRVASVIAITYTIFVSLMVTSSLHLGFPNEIPFGSIEEAALQIIAASTAVIMTLYCVYQLTSMLESLLQSSRNRERKDPLTNLCNRRSLMQQVADLMYSKEDETYIAMIDIDHFKAINDTHGHASGDKALIQLAQALKQHTRNSDIVARYGGEEFVVVMPKTSLQQAEMVAERLRKSIEEMTFKSNGTSIKMTISIGLTGSSSNLSHTKDFETLLNVADSAMYESKQAGRNRCTTLPA